MIAEVPSSVQNWETEYKMTFPSALGPRSTQGCQPSVGDGVSPSFRGSDRYQQAAGIGSPCPNSGNMQAHLSNL